MSWWSDRDFRPSTTKKVEKILDIIAEIAKAEYERGKEDEKRWWSGFCAKCTDEDGEWISKAISIIDDMQREGIIDYEQAREYRMRARMKGADDE